MDIRTTRRNNLRYALLEAGGVRQLAAFAQVSEKYLKQILAGFQGPKDKSPRQIGDDAARRIEAGLHHEMGWFDVPHPELWSALPPARSGDGDIHHSDSRTAKIAEHSDWPFSASYDAYMALSNEKKRRLDEYVSAFIDGATTSRQQKNKVA